MYYLFPNKEQFQPLQFETLSELDIYCSENKIGLVLFNETALKTKLLCKKWNIEYYKGMYKNTFIGY